MTDLAHGGTTGTTEPQTVKVWDPVVRLFHWGTVIGFATAYLAAEENQTIHEWSGYAVLALLGIRIVWGLIGSKHARFSDFLKSPATVVGYLKAIRHGHPRRYLGHNPAGGAMVMALMLGIVMIGMSGFLMTTDRFWGIDWVRELHELAVNATLILIGLHLGGVWLASRQHSENLVLAMLTGRKARETDPNQTDR